MSIWAVAGTSSSSQLAGIQSQYQQVRNQFKQLGQDLQAGNLSQAQSDFVTLSQSAATQFGSSSPIAQSLNTIGQDLQSGNLSAAQQAFNSITQASSAATTHHHHHSGGEQLSQSLGQLGQAIQSGNMSAAAQALATVQMTWQQVSGNMPASSLPTAPPATTVNVSA